MDYLYYFFLSFVFASAGCLIYFYLRHRNKLKKLTSETETDKKKDISSRESLFTALSACLGTGNIIGIGIMLVAFGPGTIFWLWIQALLGLVFKYFEAFFTVVHRNKNHNGESLGGPMFYIESAAGPKKGRFFGGFYALLVVFLALTAGNMIQANAVTTILETNLGINIFITSFTLSVLVFLVIRGGIKGIVSYLNKILPFMLITYVLACLILLYLNRSQLPQAIQIIFTDAFSGRALAGGSLFIVVKYGILRGTFTNEAGIGFGAIAHGASHNQNPHKEGLIASLGTVIDTLFVCTLTALVLLSSQFVLIENGQVSIDPEISGNIITNLVFIDGLQGLGFAIITISIMLFGFASILGWFYYGEVAVYYLFKNKNKKIFAYLFSILIFFSAFIGYRLLWEINDYINTGLLFINATALLILASRYFRKRV